MLRQAEKLGFRVSVYDESKFWGRWDYSALAREVGAWNAHVAGFVRALEAALGEADGMGESPITANPAYYEAGGIGPEIAKTLAKLARKFA